MDADIIMPGDGDAWQQEQQLVDGVSNAQVEAWFREVDGQSKGFISPSESLAFFKRTSLPKETLSKVSPKGLQTIVD